MAFTASAMASSGCGYLLGSLLHATGKAPSQLLAEALGLAPESATKLLVMPALSILGVLCFQIKQVVRTGKWWEAVSGSLTGVIAIIGVLGYMAGAYFADMHSYLALWGIAYAFFAPVAAVFIMYTGVISVFGVNLILKGNVD